MAGLVDKSVNGIIISERMRQYCIVAFVAGLPPIERIGW
jgi:hypothetical protein